MTAFVRWLVDHATTVVLAVLSVFLFGLLSWATLPREAAPDVPIPVVIVTTPYPGVSPEDIEGLISIPMENELSSLRGIKELRSTSAEGVGIVVVEFEPDVVIEDALQKVRDRVSRVRPDLPEDVEEPSVREISMTDIPIVLVTLAGGGLDEEGLEDLAENLKDDVSRIPGVLDAKITGGMEREIRVQVVPERLAHYGLAMHDVVGAIRDENVNIPGGNVSSGRGDVLLRVPGEFTDPIQLEEVAIKRVGDRPVFVRDVARVVDGFADRASYSRMAGKASVTLSVTKRAGANILEVAEGVKQAARDHQERWPTGVEYRILGDQSKRIEAQVADLQNNILTALVLVVGVMVFFMGLRNSLFVAIAIPLSMLMSFMVLDMLGFTLNMVVLFSLILALGMLVDNGIVIVENVYRHAEMGKDRRTAAVDGTAEVAMPVLASTATTVAAFAPLVFWTGIMGKFMGYLPKTVIIVLTSSLVVALVVLPVVMSRLMPQVDLEAAAGKPEFIRDLPLPLPMRIYKQVLEWSISLRYGSVLGGVAMLLGTFVIYGLLNHGTEFFPATDPERVRVGVQMPQGVELESTDQVVRQVEALLAREPNVDTWVAEAGVSASGDALRGSNNLPNEARITVDFLPSAADARPGEQVRVESTSITTDRLREVLSQVPGARITVEPEAMGPPVGADIEVLVSGDDFDEVGTIAQRLRRDLAAIPGVTDLEDDYRVGRPEMRLRVDRGAAKRVGVSTAAVGNAVRTAVAGSTASALREGEEEHDIVVELAPEYRDDLQAILDLRLPGREDTSPNTFPVPVSTVAGYELVGGSGSINHIDQDLVVTVKGDILADFNENEVRAKVQELLDGYELPEGYHLSTGGADREQQEAVAFLGRAFLIAVALILMVLVTQFDSLAMPLIILGTVILSMIGVLWGLLLTGTPFGVIMTGIGVISLAGVVVNNAIVLLDYVQQLRERGLSVHDALIEAGLTRFRPVMLTAVTTTLGLVPMALGLSVDFTRLRITAGSASAQMWGPMAVAVIFGLTFATVLTLVLVPTLYSIYDDLDRMGGRLLAGRAKQAVAAAALLLVAGRAEAVTLAEAWQAAEQHNIGLQLAKEQAIQTSTMRAKAWSTVQPRVEASATYVINSQEVAFDFADSIPPAFLDFIDPADMPPPTIVQQKTAWLGELSVSQRLFSGTALPLLKGANAMSRAAWLQVDRARQQTRAGVTRAYWSLWTAQQAEEVSAGALANAESQLELATRQVDAGLAPQRARIQAELGVARAQRELERAREQRVIAEEAFTIATGLRDPSLEEPPPFQIPETVAVALAEAERSRADVAAASLQEDAAQAQLTGKRLQWLPVVDGKFAYHYDQNAAFGQEPLFWRASIRASWSLWDGGMRVAEARELASQKRAAELRRRQLTMDAEQEVRVAWEAYQRARSAVSSVERELELAQENLRLAEASFAAGAATWLEVQEAELGLRSAELNQIREEMNRELAAVELLASTGTL